jgi:glycosyltransferase involved in cell wall biosynthesis
MLLDNHYGPDPRVEFELDLLREADTPVRVIAWDRRADGGVSPSVDESVPGATVVRVPVPAPPGGGRRSLVAMARFGRRVWRDRSELLRDVSTLVVHDVYLLPLGWLLAQRERIPFVYDAHEEYGRMEATRYPAWFLRVVTAIESRLARDAAAVIVPGRSRRKRWLRARRDHPIVLPNIGRGRERSRDRTQSQWDVLYAGTLSRERRIDLLLELARVRPDLSIAVAGRGRAADQVAAEAENLPNLTYLGWRHDAETLFAGARSVYYGLDPSHPYSDVACPNTLYQALRHGRPLVFFCGGEMEELASEFKIGIRCKAGVADLAAAVDEILATPDEAWEFDRAWEAVWARTDTDAFVALLAKPLQAPA